MVLDAILDCFLLKGSKGGAGDKVFPMVERVPSVSVSVPIMRVAAPLHTIPESLLHLFSTDARKRWRRVMLAHKVLSKWKRRTQKETPPSERWWQCGASGRSALSCFPVFIPCGPGRLSRSAPVGNIPGSSPNSPSPVPGSASPQSEPEGIPLEQRVRQSWNMMRWRVRTTGVFKVFNKVGPAFMTADRNQLMAMAKLKESIGDKTVASKEEAKKVQKMLEKKLKTKLDFKLKEGDIVLSNFDNLEGRKATPFSAPSGPVFDKRRRKQRKRANLELKKRLRRLQGNTKKLEKKTQKRRRNSLRTATMMQSVQAVHFADVEDDEDQEEKAQERVQRSPPGSSSGAGSSNKGEAAARARARAQVEPGDSAAQVQESGGGGGDNGGEAKENAKKEEEEKEVVVVVEEEEEATKESDIIIRVEEEVEEKNCHGKTEEEEEEEVEEEERLELATPSSAGGMSETEDDGDYDYDLELDDSEEEDDEEDDLSSRRSSDISAMSSAMAGDITMPVPIIVISTSS